MESIMAEPAQCRRCKRRNLRAAASRSAGIGPRCAAIEAAFDGLSDKQRDKARQLAGHAVKIRKGVYKVPSASGADPYIAFTDGNCMCPWGLHRKAADKVCAHVAVARLKDRPRLSRSSLAKAA